jgi:isopentenyl diphosphate isomerase/L-lactate dehydrogenase-like FMN-dependent dehydrogenase
VSVIADGGVRAGADVFRALALGAQAVMIGRPYLWALAVGGEAGVGELLGGLRAELAEVMAAAGCRTVEEIGRQHLVDRSLRGAGGDHFEPGRSPRANKRTENAGPFGVTAK